MATDRTEGPDSIPYTQDGNHSGAGESAFANEVASAPKKSGFGNLILGGAGLVFVLVVALVGYKMLTGGKAPPPQAAPAPVAAQPSTPDPAVAGEPMTPAVDPGAAMDPNAGLPSDGQPGQMVDPNAPASPVGDIDPSTGLPSVHAAPAPTETPVESPAPTTPAVANPTAQPDPAVQAPVGEAAVVPAVAAPVAPAVVQAPAVPSSTPAPEVAPSGSINQLRTDILGALDRFQQTLSALDKRVDDRFADVERRLSALEVGRPSAAPAAPKPVASTSKPHHKPVVHRAPKPRPAPVNRVEIISRADISAPQVIAAPIKAPAETGCSIASIQPGRFWVRRQDGSFSTYGVDDRLDGGRITRVDPEAGVYVDGRRWNCGGN